MRPGPSRSINGGTQTQVRHGIIVMPGLFEALSSNYRNGVLTFPRVLATCVLGNLLEELVICLGIPELGNKQFDRCS